jgi:hypothetical protein
MSSSFRRGLLFAAIFALAAIFFSINSGAQSSVSVTWTNLVSANAKGSSLTPTAANGNGQSSQSITSGNGSLIVSAWSYSDGNFTTFGLTNGAFTGDPTQINYGWRSYGDWANCRLNGDNLNGLIQVAQGDTLEVRINGTTVEYYHNSTLVYSLPNQTISYPYRAAATFTASTSPVVLNATLTGVSTLQGMWTNLSGATTSGTSLTPSAANGHAESSQTITYGNGSLAASAWSYSDGNFTTFGLTNGAFTGDPTQINYGWRSYGDWANCRLNGDNLNGLIQVAQGDTLEVRINGTTVEYYHNSTLVYSLPNQTISYPYRAAATFTASTSPVITSASMTGTTSSGKTNTPAFAKADTGVYPDPSPLPTIPPVNTEITDPIFGSHIIRATDGNTTGPNGELYCTGPGCSTFYSNWPAFNSNNTFILFRDGTGGNSTGLIRAFDPVNFRVNQTFFPGFTHVDGIGDEAMNFESAFWDPIDPKVIYCLGGNPEVPMALYKFTINSTGTGGTYTQVRDFSSFRSSANGGSPQDQLAQMSMSKDGTVFSFNVRRNGAGELPIAYLVWNSVTNMVLYTPIPNQDVNEVDLDKSGHYLYIVNQPGCAGCVYVSAQVLNLDTGHIENIMNGPGTTDDSPGHGADGTGTTAGRGASSAAYNFRYLNDLHHFQIVFDNVVPNCSNPKEGDHPCTDWTQEPTSSLHSNSEFWLTVGTHHDYDAEIHANSVDRGLLRNEIVQISLDGSQRIRRLAHTYSVVVLPIWSTDTLTILQGRGLQPKDANSYWAAPHASISKDGKFIAYTSNWGNSDRFDVFILKVTNPIDESRFFAFQQYMDFLNRLPDASGLDFWTQNIEGCGSDANCIAVKRIDTSAAFFLSIEFQQTGDLVYKMYKAAFGNLPGKPVAMQRGPFIADTHLVQSTPNRVIVGQAGWQNQLEANKQEFASVFVQRSAFQSAHGSQDAATYVDSLFANTGVTPTADERNAAISAFGSGDTAGQAAALRSVALSNSVSTHLFDEAFVLMEYFGYLQRDPDAPPEATLDFQGYNFWLGKLNQFGGNYIQAEMVKAFLTSPEYRQRFGPDN